MTVPFRHRFVLRLTDSIPSLINVLPSLSSEKVEVKGKKKTKWTDNIYCQNVEDLYLYIYINHLFIESSIYSESGGNKFLFSTISQFFFSLSLSLSLSLFLAIETRHLLAIALTELDGGFGLQMNGRSLPIR